jgi:hypothetical protein
MDRSGENFEATEHSAGDRLGRHPAAGSLCDNTVAARGTLTQLAVFANWLDSFRITGLNPIRFEQIKKLVKLLVKS